MVKPVSCSVFSHKWESLKDFAAFSCLLFLFPEFLLEEAKLYPEKIISRCSTEARYRVSACKQTMVHDTCCVLNYKRERLNDFLAPSFLLSCSLHSCLRMPRQTHHKLPLGGPQQPGNFLEKKEWCLTSTVCLAINERDWNISRLPSALCSVP